MLPTQDAKKEKEAEKQAEAEENRKTIFFLSSVLYFFREHTSRQRSFP